MHQEMLEVWEVLEGGSTSFDLASGLTRGDNLHHNQFWSYNPHCVSSHNMLDQVDVYTGASEEEERISGLDRYQKDSSCD